MQLIPDNPSKRTTNQRLLLLVESHISSGERVLFIGTLSVAIGTVIAKSRQARPILVTGWFKKRTF